MWQRNQSVPLILLASAVLSATLGLQFLGRGTAAEPAPGASIQLGAASVTPVEPTVVDLPENSATGPGGKPFLLPAGEFFGAGIPSRPGLQSVHRGGSSGGIARGAAIQTVTKTASWHCPSLGQGSATETT